MLFKGERIMTSSFFEKNQARLSPTYSSFGGVGAHYVLSLLFLILNVRHSLVLIFLGALSGVSIGP